MSQRPVLARGCVGGAALAGIVAFCAVMLTVIVTIGIWPGELKLTAPLLCSDTQPDAFVVADTYSIRPGETTTNFTMYCMGPRGDTTDVGFLRPAALLTAVHAVPVVLFLGALAARAARRTTRRTPGAPSAVTRG
ncbi:MAG: hypothetical protein S0880_11310 [Actinomycetota bacterium]|nr:hypothetical protein [Actinomycetota bacterium]